jgi:hypothetical protein
MAQVFAFLLFVTAVVLWLRHAARQKAYLSAPAARRDAPGLPVSGCTAQQGAFRPSIAH